MKIRSITKQQPYLYEGLDKSSMKTMMLWEGVGKSIVEAQLTQDEIVQLFQNIEQAAKASGTNRTIVGKGVDLTAKINQAFSQLKNQVASSNIVQNFDQLYDQASEKLKQATGGDQGVMQYVQKYRNFAKKHPVAQSLIYGALIAAAGISGAGAGGAAALGLLKMTDQLLQGAKFSSAAYSGAKTGAMAYAAGQVGKALQGDQATTTTSTSTQQGYMDSIPLKGSVHPDWLKQYPTGQFQYQWDGSEGWRVVDKASNKLMATFTSGSPPVDTLMPGVTDNFESINLSNDQILVLFETISINSNLWGRYLEEAAGWDKFKSGLKQAAGGVGQMASGAAQGAKSVVEPYVQRAAQKVQQVGSNLANKITLDKLQTAWERAGKPTDSNKISKVLAAAGVSNDITKSVYSSMGIPLTQDKTATKTGTKSQTTGAVSKGERLSKQATAGTPNPSSGLASFLSGMGFDSAAKDAETQAATDFNTGKQTNLVKQATMTKTTMSPSGEPETITWNPNSRIMTIDGNKYKKTTKGWEDFNTKEKIDPKYVRELETAFNQVTGRAPATSAPTTSYQPKIGALGRRGATLAQPAQPTQPTQPATVVGKVVTPGGIEVVKYSDGSWEIPATDEKVVISSDLKKLEELLAQQQQEEPDVFKSNRPAK